MVRALQDDRPGVGELAAEMGERVTVAKINIDENPGVPQKYGVRGVPTLMIFSQGQSPHQGGRAAEIQDQGMDRKLDRRGTAARLDRPVSWAAHARQAAPPSRSAMPLN